MRRQAFSLGQTDGRWRKRSEAFRTGPLDTHPFEEVIQAKARAETRCATGRQNVI